LSITSVDVVADQTARLNLTAEEGDVAIQTDVNETFVLSTNDPTVDSNWKKVQLDVVGAIDGQTITPGQIGTNADRPTIKADDINSNLLETPFGIGNFETWMLAEGDNRTGAITGTRATDAVGSTATSIYNADDSQFSRDMRSNLVHVMGRNPNDGAQHFTDIVVFLPFGTATVIGSGSRSVSASRTYSPNGNSLELSISSGSFDVICYVSGLAVR
jgi:hypothetical protein